MKKVFCTVYVKVDEARPGIPLDIELLEGQKPLLFAPYSLDTRNGALSPAAYVTSQREVDQMFESTDVCGVRKEKKFALNEMKVRKKAGYLKDLNGKFVVWHCVLPAKVSSAQAFVNKFEAKENTCYGVPNIPRVVRGQPEKCHAIVVFDEPNIRIATEIFHGTEAKPASGGTGGRTANPPDSRKFKLPPWMWIAMILVCIVFIVLAVLAATRSKNDKEILTITEPRTAYLLSNDA